MQKTLSFLLVATFALSSLVPSFAPAVAVTEPAQTDAKTTVVIKPAAVSKKAVVAKKRVVKKAVVAKKPVAAVKKPAAKTVTIQAKKAVVVPAKPKGSVATVSASAISVPVTTCMQAVKKANTFCAKIAKGCNSTSVTPKCVKANEECEVQQNAALALCPAI